MIQIIAAGATLNDSVNLLNAVQKHMAPALTAKYGTDAKVYVEGTVAADGRPEVKALRPIV